MKLIQKMFHVTVLILTILETKHTAYGGPISQYFLSTPQNTTVTAGHHTRLTCSIGNMAGTCQWSKDGFALGTDRNLPGYSRYMMGMENNCDLSIDPVLPLDEGIYQCQASGGHGVAPIISKPVKLTVNSEPGQPYIIQGREIDVMKVKDGEEVELQCESQGGRPPSEIQWWDTDTGRRIISDVTEHVTRMEDMKTFKTVSTLKFKPSGEMRVKCSAHNDAFPVGKESHPMTIKVKGQPSVEMMELEDGDSVKISCSSEEYPQKMKFKWFINDVELSGEKENILEIQEFSKSYDGSMVKCSMKGIGDSYELNKLVKLVHKQTTFQKTDSLERKARKYPHENLPKKNGITKKTLLVCQFEDDYTTEPKYVWINGNVKKIEKDESVDAFDDDRKYKCKVIPKGTKKINRMSLDMKKMSKTLRRFSKSLTGLTSTFNDT